jgi:hypothetical protein
LLLAVQPKQAQPTVAQSQEADKSMWSTSICMVLLTAAIVAVAVVGGLVLILKIHRVKKEKTKKK